MSIFTYQSRFQQAIAKIQSLKAVPQKGKQWAEDGAIAMRQQVIKNLQDQPHSPISDQLRTQPSGSGIRKHVHISHRYSSSGFAAVAGIKSGRPSMIARVQNRGITIKVTNKMRGFFRARGVPMRAKTTAIRIRGSRFWDRAWSSTKQKQLKKLRQILR